MGGRSPLSFGEPVWVHMDGFPWWPARIVTSDDIQLDPGEVMPTLRPNELLVEFFNDEKRFAAIERGRLRPFSNSRFRSLNRHYNGMYLESVILAVTDADRYLSEWLGNGLPKVKAEPGLARPRRHASEPNPTEPRPTTVQTRGVKRRVRGAATSANSSPAPAKKKKSARALTPKVEDVELVHVASNQDSNSDGQQPPGGAPPSVGESRSQPLPPTFPRRAVASDAGSSRMGRPVSGKTGRSSGGKTAAEGKAPMDTRSTGSMVAEPGPSASVGGKSGGLKKEENGQAVLAANGLEDDVDDVIEHVPAQVPSMMPRKGIENGISDGGVDPRTKADMVGTQRMQTAESTRWDARAKGGSALAGHSQAELRGMVAEKDELNKELTNEVAELNSTIRQLQARIGVLERRLMGGYEMISRGISLIQEGQSALREGKKGHERSGRNN
eukprot:GFKZ01008941.1.p1 GENE.GFKZ01008941.1~~GFKZ01008941.1.p1  ORF type:complete len:516 (+),score=67.65 GFKZ01008941.1:225-1550(+)